MQVGAGSAETRKTVTVLFCDLVGSTALGESVDPEVLRRLLTRYFETARAAVEGHGGTVEKFIGDAVMAAFGMPVVHEDDALRAVRAAAGLRGGIEELGAELGMRLEVRIGIQTGEVVAAEDPDGKTLYGDAVNTAARLEQAAGAGEILLGDPTHRLVAGAVRAVSVEPLAAKGKAQPVRAWRLLGLVEGAEAVARRFLLPALRAKLLVSQGRAEEAETVAREALAIAYRTEMVELRARACQALAGVLIALGRDGEAASLLGEVVAMWERKGFVVQARRAREQLARLGR